MPEEQQRVPRIPGSFEAFYREEYRRMAALAYALSGRWEVAEDLAQEAFLRAHRDWHRVRSFASPEGWIRRVVTNLAMSRFRRLRSETAARLRLTVDEQAPPPDPEHAAFWEEVRRLPRRQRQVIALHYVDDRTVAEIASLLAIAEGTVKALLHQGRQRLKDRLVRRGIGP